MFDSDSDFKPKHYDFGWWPEIFGFFLVLAVVWFLFYFAQGEI